MQRPISYAAAGTGVALGATALVTGLVSAHLRSNVESDVNIHKQNFGENCDKGNYGLCAYDRVLINNTADQADRYRNATLGLAIAGGVLTAAGVVLFIFSAEDKDQTPSTEAQPAPKAGHRQAPRNTAKASFSCGLSSLSSLTCAGTF